jgi:hypothetical protein
VSLILPAVTVKNTETESNYSALTEIYGTKRETATTVIGESAFKNFTALTKAEFPDTTEPIGESAFQGCTSLKEVNFPKVTGIGESAFYGCTLLETVYAINVMSIGISAFHGCTTLGTMSFPQLESIGNFAFAASGPHALIISMKAIAPSVGTNIFNSVGSAKTVTINVDLGATGYDDTWKTDFKGENDNITVTVTYRS